MDGMAYDLCVICGDYVFDYEVDDLGEAFFAFGTALPSHHNECLRERFAITGTLDPAYVASNKPEVVGVAREFLRKRAHSLGSRDTGESPPLAGPGPERPAAWTPSGADVVPVFPCRYAFPACDAVLFPHVVNARQVIRSPYEQRLIRSVVRACPPGTSPDLFFAAFVPVKDPAKIDDFTPADFHSCGVVARVSLEGYHEDTSRELFATIECLHRVQIAWVDGDASNGATAMLIPDVVDLDFTVPETAAKLECLAELAENLGDVYVGSVVLDRLRNRREVIRRDEVSLLLDAFGFGAGVSSLWADQLFPYRYAMLEAPSLALRLDAAIDLARELLRFAQTTRRLNSECEVSDREESRRERIRAQIKALQVQLGTDDENEFVAYERLLEELASARPPLHPLVLKEAKDQLNRLKRYKPEDSTYSKLANWLDFFFGLPWTRRTDDNFDLVRAKQILDEDHFNLRNAKDRILEYIALLKRQGERRELIARGKIEDRDEYKRRVVLCFLGPPGVGKTSLGRSIARALGRRFCRISLGGVEDEHEITGFEETYHGSMPGQLIRGIMQAGSRNPVFMIDEVDKTKKTRGNPEAAFLATLDSTLSDGFVDKYVRAPFDLSEVLFIATANSLEGMMPALVDRMEIIELPGYTTREKLEIAKRHLIPNALRYHAIRETVEFPDEAIVALIGNWTQEAGVRTLDRQIAKICRKIITDVWGEDTFQLTTRALAGYLGPKTVHGEAGTLARQPGVAMGLAYTETGGTIMVVEAEQYAARTRFVRIEDQISVTGRVASVMQESILLALKRVRRLAEDRNNAFGISKASFEKTRFDLNVSPLAVEKDGPSGAVAVFVTLVSVLSGVCVDADVAMTGELNQRGMVLPVGGLAQKFGAAHRQGIKRVLYPWQLEEEVEHLKQDYGDLKELTFIPIRNDREVLEYAFSEYLASTDP